MRAPGPGVAGRFMRRGPVPISWGQSARRHCPWRPHAHL